MPPASYHYALDDKGNFTINGFVRETHFGFDSRLLRSVRVEELRKALQEEMGIRVRSNASMAHVMRLYWQAVAKTTVEGQERVFRTFATQPGPDVAWYEAQCVHYGVVRPRPTSVETKTTTTTTTIPACESYRQQLWQAFLSNRLNQVPQEISNIHLKLRLEQSQKNALQWKEWKKKRDRVSMIEKDPGRFFGEWSAEHRDVNAFMVYKSTTEKKLHNLQELAEAKGLRARIVNPGEFLHCLVVAKSEDALNRKCDAIMEELTTKLENNSVKRQLESSNKAHDLKKKWRPNSEWDILGHWVLRCDEADDFPCEEVEEYTMDVSFENEGYWASFHLGFIAGVIRMLNQPSESKRKVSIQWRGKETTSDDHILVNSNQKGTLEFSKCAHHVKGVLHSDFGKFTITGKKTDQFSFGGWALADEYKNAYCKTSNDENKKYQR